MNSGFPRKPVNVAPRTHIQNKQNNTLENGCAASLLSRLKLPRLQLHLIAAPQLQSGNKDGSRTKGTKEYKRKCGANKLRKLRTQFMQRKEWIKIDGQMYADEKH